MFLLPKSGKRTEFWGCFLLMKLQKYIEIAKIKLKILISLATLTKSGQHVDVFGKSRTKKLLVVKKIEFRNKTLNKLNIFNIL
jgi:hypothetical protein